MTWSTIFPPVNSWMNVLWPRDSNGTKDRNLKLNWTQLSVRFIQYGNFIQFVFISKKVRFSFFFGVENHHQKVASIRIYENIEYFSRKFKKNIACYFKTVALNKIVISLFLCENDFVAVFFSCLHLRSF